jgi:hypothetical protein
VGNGGTNAEVGHCGDTGSGRESEEGVDPLGDDGDAEYIESVGDEAAAVSTAVGTAAVTLTAAGTNMGGTTEFAGETGEDVLPLPGPIAACAADSTDKLRMACSTSVTEVTDAISRRIRPDCARADSCEQ